MFSSFMLGIFASIAGIVGTIAVILSGIGFAFGGSGAPYALALGLVLWFVSAYFGYVSRNTVRIKT